MRTPSLAARVTLSRQRLLNHPGHDQKSHGRKGGGGPGSGRDLTDDLDYDAIAAGKHNSPVDKMLGRIQREQGFDGPAQQVDEAEWQRLQDEGGTVVFRGVRGVEDGSTAEEIVQGYAEGELVPTRGNYGSGTYFTTSQATADKYASGEAFGGAVFEDAGSFTGGATAEVMLMPGARVLEWRESDRLRQDVGGMGVHDIPSTPRQRVLADEGRMAAALGYDAVRVSLGDTDYGDELIVLNRTATAVRA